MQLTRLLGLAGLCGCLIACGSDTQDRRTRSLNYEASYQLLFNDAPVGEALFTLHVSDDGDYRIQAFTVPSGKMTQAEGHEVLESSQGTVNGDYIQPVHFRHSVMEDGELSLLDLAFDWENGAMVLSNGEESRQIALLPDTHDRLSYLLAAKRLAAAGEGLVTMQIAGPQATEASVLEAEPSIEIEVPAGRYQAVGIRRLTPESEEKRVLWYAPTDCPLPLKVIHETTDNTVDMVLRHCIELPAQTASATPAQST